MFKLLFDVHQCSPVLSISLTSNKLYWIEDQLADVSTPFYTSASWHWRVGIGELNHRQLDWIPMVVLKTKGMVFSYMDQFRLGKACFLLMVCFFFCLSLIGVEMIPNQG